MIGSLLECSVNQMLENDKKAAIAAATPSLGTALALVCPITRVCVSTHTRHTTRNTLDGSGDSWAPSSILMEGTLTKLGGHATKLKLINRGNWRARWCQLSPTHLAYFKCRSVRVVHQPPHTHTHAPHTHTHSCVR
jgi:hypothetical protein